MSSDIETADGELPSAGVDPAAPRPPFHVAVDIPEPWLLLDLDPRTSRAWVRQLVQMRAAGRAWPSEDQQTAERALADVIAALRAQGVLLAAILAGSLGQEVVGASLTVSWRETQGGLDLDSLGSSLARAVPAADELVHHRRVDVLALRTRQAVRLRTRQLATVPGSTQRREVALHQLFVPMADTNWMAVVTATTGLLRLSAAVGDTAAHVAESIRAGDAMR